MKYLFKHIYIILLISSCANIVLPDGGEKDNKAPRIKQVKPSENQVPVNTSEIQIQFNEYIKVKDQNKLTINPFNIKLKSAEVKGKNLYIKTDSIPENTTVSINLGDAIADITEENIIKDQSLILYTGPTPDSNKLSITAFKPSNTKGTLKALLFQTELPDSNPREIEPQYIFKSNQKDIQCIGLPRKSFYVIVLNDENDNNKIDEGELTGFFKEPLIPDTNNTQYLKTYLYRDNTFIDPRLIDFYSKQYGTFEFITYPKDLRKRLIDNNLFTEEAHTVVYPGKDNDTIVWYSPMADMTEGHFDLFLNDVYFRDLTSNHMNNTYMMRKLKISDPSGQNESLLDQGDTVKLLVNNPIYKFNKEKCEIYIDSIKQKSTDIFYFTDNEKTRFRIKDVWKPQHNYIFKFLPGAFEDVFYQKNDTFQLVFRTKKESEYGSATLRFKNCFTDNLRGILLDEQDHEVRSFKIKEKEAVDLQYLSPGKYHIMLFEDLNLNKELDPGYMRKKELPEPYYFINQIIEIIPNIQQDNIEISLSNVN